MRLTTKIRVGNNVELRTDLIEVESQGNFITIKVPVNEGASMMNVELDHEQLHEFLSRSARNVQITAGAESIDYELPPGFTRRGPWKQPKDTAAEIKKRLVEDAVIEKAVQPPAQAQPSPQQSS